MKERQFYICMISFVNIFILNYVVIFIVWRMLTNTLRKLIKDNDHLFYHFYIKN